MSGQSVRGGKRPSRHHTVNPLLIVQQVASLVQFLSRVFDAIEVQQLARPDGTLIYAEVLIDDSLVMIMEPAPGAPPLPCSLAIYADDVDDSYRRAVAEGAQSVQAPADHLNGHRTARIIDPAGNRWTIHTVTEARSPADQLAALLARRRTH